MKESLPSTKSEKDKKEFSAAAKETVQETQTKKKVKSTRKNLSENGQTLLDVSKGDIRITQSGAVGGGLAEDETNLNEKGYWLTGTTEVYNVVVERDVKTNLTLAGIDITASSKVNCIDVSHADVTITLRRENRLTNNSGSVTAMASNSGNGLNKDGMDGSLTLQCELSGEKGHKCDEMCGSLKAYGDRTLYHSGAIGSSWKNHTVSGENGFSNFTIKGGNIEASAGGHTPGIGSACDSERYGGFTKNIVITGGNVTATGTQYGSGIGSGFGNKVHGVTISGGVVKAYGGEYAPGIGASSCEEECSWPSKETRDVKISGGDTLVTAVGHEKTKMPGIGSGGGNMKVFNVTAVPDFGYQGYIQDGISASEYSFVEGTPFKEQSGIEVGNFFTMVYFGPFRDVNEIEKESKEQIGANHIISKSGGAAFTESQLKGLAKVTAKQADGTDFSEQDLDFTDSAQIKSINEAKTAGRVGKFPLTFTTPGGTKTTITVYLKSDGTDAAQMNPEEMEPTIGADGFSKESGGDPLGQDEVRQLAQVQGKDADGATYDMKDFTPDGKEFKAINEAKTAGKGGVFDLTFTSPDGKKATVKVVLKAYDATKDDEITGESIRGFHIISKTGGKGFTEEQLKNLSDTEAVGADGVQIPKDSLIFPYEDQIKVINEAKIAGKTGDFPLSIETPDGTGITICVYLRDSGIDRTEDTSGKGSIGANNITRPTGGEGFHEQEIIELCQAKGKDIYGNNVTARPDETQLALINKAKKAGKTGEFSLAFSLEDGSRAKVTVILTGEHRVSFDSAGGNYQPKDQMIAGGKTVSEPKDPERQGYKFQGWYFIDEDGKEEKWNFDTPVHQSMTLKAKWEKEPFSKDSTEEQKRNDGDNWNYKEVGEKSETQPVKTGDIRGIQWGFFCMAGAAGLLLCLFKRKKY